jgi:16S rRNA (uracil1498-N3)-methyltransferase
MEYYYTSKTNIEQNKLFITGEEAKHLSKVLRKKPGEEIYVTDGERNVYRSEIQSIDRGKIVCRITEKFYNLNEPSVQISLHQALLKNPSRFEFVIEKATELGVYEINPIITENVINKTHDKTDRWQTIALPAIKQSQRCYLPLVNHPIYFEEAIKSLHKNQIKLIADERQSTTNIEKVKSILSKNKNAGVSLFIGPEGGFSQNEIELAKGSGFDIINLGPRKYRSETAAIVALTLMLL